MMLSERLQEMLLLPPAKWAGLFHKYHQAQGEDGEMTEVLREVEALSQKLALLHGYLNSRLLGKNHDKAVTKANQNLTSVRKMLGFTYPRSAAFSF